MNRPPLFTIMSEQTGIPPSILDDIIRSAPRRYKVFSIPKRNGGERKIAHPAKELKILQRYLMENLLERFPVHTSATAYVKGKSIRSNVEPHVSSDAIAKLDFKDFFPSLRPYDFRTCVKLSKKTQIADEDLSWIERILFFGYGTNEPSGLSIGAPSSPMICNIIMHKFDKYASFESKNFNVKYTRYADDITISGDVVNVNIVSERIRKWIKSCASPILFFNNAKGGVFQKGERRQITGLVVTPSGLISIGRENKRRTSAQIHQALLGSLTFDELYSLSGYLSYINDVEPEFLVRMRKKYGNGAVDTLMRRKISNSRPRRADS